MGQTLSHGVYLPAEGERNCYSGLASNWNLLDTAIGDIAGKASATHTHGNITNDGKLATASKALVTDSNKNITTSSVSDTELGYLSGVTSAIQTQLNAKAADSDVVHKAGNETIGGNKKFSLAIELLNGRIYRDAASLTKGTLPSERTYYGITNDFALDSSDSSHRINQCRCWVETNGNNVMEWNLSAWNTTSLATLRLSVAADGSNKTYVIGATTIPEGNSVHDLGSSSYQWNNLYTKNYFYNGTAWGLDKANAWTGSNSFKNITLSANAESVEILHNTWHGYEQYYTRGTSNYPNYDTFLKWNSNRYDNTIGLYRSVGVLTSTTEGATVDDIDETFAYYIYHINAKYVDFMNNVRIVNDGTSDILAPISNGTTDLGTSSAKWKTLNGINPGALSLPNFSAEFDVSGQIVPPTGENQISINWGRNTFTPSVNGWLSVRIHKATSIEIYRSIRSSYCVASRVESADDICVCSPVVAGVEYTIKIQATQFSSDYDHFRLSPCLGNV